MSDLEHLVKPILLLAVLLAVGYLGYLVFTNKTQGEEEFYQEEEEGFTTHGPADSTVVESESGDMQDMGVGASEPLGDNEQPSVVNQEDATRHNQLPSECMPKDVLSSAELLPADANSLYAQVNPSGQGSLQDQNLLTAGYHVGVNTVGQSLRNANRQLRSDPPNPQVKVSPWMQTTIEPDLNRAPLEIGPCN